MVRFVLSGILDRAFLSGFEGVYDLMFCAMVFEYPLHFLPKAYRINIKKENADPRYSVNHVEEKRTLRDPAVNTPDKSRYQQGQKFEQSYGDYERQCY